MGNETLFTFLLDSIPSCSRVELFGSWDNFSKAYPMTRDKRRGPGHWVGCHTFANIICDGDPQHLTKRDGCLLAGGTYWYFYKRDDYVEFHSAVEPYTTTCPLLPGQTVNVLDIPDGDRIDTSSKQESTEDMPYAFTLDPAARRQNPKPWSRPRKRPSTVDRQRQGHQHLWSKALDGIKRPHTAAALANSSSLSLGLHFSHKSRLSKWKLELPTDSPQISQEAHNLDEFSSDLLENNSWSDRPKSRHGLDSEASQLDQQQSIPTMGDIRDDLLTAYSFFSDDECTCISRAASLPHLERPATAYRPLSRRCATAPSYWAPGADQLETIQLNLCQRPEVGKGDLKSLATKPDQAYTEVNARLGAVPKDIPQSYKNYRWSGSTGVRWSRIEDSEYRVDLSHGLDLDLGREFSLDLSFPSESSHTSGLSTAFSSLCSFNERSSQEQTRPSSHEFESAAQSSSSASLLGGQDFPQTDQFLKGFDLARRATDPIRTSDFNGEFNMSTLLSSKFLATSRELDDRLASQETITPSNATCTSTARRDDHSQQSLPPFPLRAPPPPPPARAPPRPPNVSTLRNLFS